MKGHRRVMLVVLLAVLLAASCTKVIVPTPLADIRQYVNKNLLYLGTSAGTHLVVDPADQAKIYAVSSGNAALFAQVAPFSEVRPAAEDASQPVYLETVRPAFYRNVPVITAANDKEAARLYPPALMDHLLNSCFAEFAVEAYSIKSSKLNKVTGNVATIEFVVDLKPVSNQFSKIKSRWGTPAADGYVRDKRLVLNLYRNAGQYCAYRSDWREIFIEGAPPVAQTPPETAYKPVVYENLWEALMQGKTVEYVLYEDQTYSYISSSRMGPDERFFGLTFQRIERAANQRTTLGAEAEGSAMATPLGRKDNLLYVQLLDAEPYSEYWDGPVVSIDLTTGERTVLLAVQTEVLGRVADTVYIAHLPGFDSAMVGSIQALNVSTGELRRVSDLPGIGYGTAYYSGCLMYSAGGKLYVMWPDLTDGSGGADRYTLFSIDIATGAIQKVN